jgi:hypothetical protein
MRSILAFGTVVLLATALLSGVAAADAETTAVVDRLGDDYAVLLIEEGGETVDQRVVEPDELPPEGRHEGAVLDVVCGEYVYDESETDSRQDRLQDLFDSLSERL